MTIPRRCAAIAIKVALLAMLCGSSAAQTMPQHLQPYMVAADVPRKAFVLGVSKYQFQQPIPSAEKDVTDVASHLKALGFTITQASDQALADADSLLSEFQTFLRGIPPRSIVLFYFSGHGFWYGGDNYLVPRDANLAAPPKDPITGAVTHPARINVAVSTIRANIASALPGQSIIIIDACRDQPVFGFPPEDPATKSSSKFQDVSGTLIFFATGEGKYSQGSIDPHENSRYTKYLLQHIEEPGLEILGVHREATEGVIFDSKNTQQPSFAGLYLSQIYLRPTEQQLEADKETWADILSLESEEKVRRFMARLPGSRYVLAAVQWLNDRATSPRSVSSSRINPLAIEVPETFATELATRRLRPVGTRVGPFQLPGLDGALALNTAQVDASTSASLNVGASSFGSYAGGPRIVVRAPTTAYAGFGAGEGAELQQSRALNPGDQLVVRKAFSFRDKNWLEAITRDDQVLYLSDFQIPDLSSLQGNSAVATVSFSGDDVLAPFDTDGLRRQIESIDPKKITGVAIRLKPSTPNMTTYIRQANEIRLDRLIANVRRAGIDPNVIAGLLSNDRQDQAPNTALFTIRYRN